MNSKLCHAIHTKMSISDSSLLAGQMAGKQVGMVIEPSWFFYRLYFSLSKETCLQSSLFEHNNLTDSQTEILECNCARTNNGIVENYFRTWHLTIYRVVTRW